MSHLGRFQRLLSISSLTTQALPKTSISRATALIAMAVTLLLWASAFVVIRYAGRYLSPGALGFARLLVGSVALGLVMVIRGLRPPSGRALMFSAICGVLWFGAYNLALNAGERRVDAGMSSLLVNTGPIFLALFAGTFLREGFPRNLVQGCAVGFAGAAVIGLAASRHHGAIAGAILCVAAAIVYAAGVTAQKPALRDSSALAVTWTACTIGMVTLAPYAPQLGHELSHAPASAIAWTIYLGVGPTATGFLFWAYALARTDVGRLGVTTYLVPPLVVVIAWVALGEVPPLLALPGGLLCLAGVALARRRS